MLVGAIVICLALAGWFAFQQQAEYEAYAPPASPSAATSTMASTSPTTAVPTTVGTAPATTASSSRTSVPTASATSHPVAIAPMLPGKLEIPRIGAAPGPSTLVSKVTAGGTIIAWDSFLGRNVSQFSTPDNMYDTIWWSDGPKPGAPGIAIIGGHTQIGGYGVFNNLGLVKPGDKATLTSRDGSHHLYLQAIACQDGISKSDPLALHTALTPAPKGHEQPVPPCGGKTHPVVHAPAGTDVITFTCSGQVNARFTSHQDNTVVYWRIAKAD